MISVETIFGGVIVFSLLIGELKNPRIFQITEEIKWDPFWGLTKFDAEVYCNFEGFPL